MRFAIISPASGLERFTSLSSTHLLLAHVQNPIYWQYYRQKAADPKQLIILDNSAYEGKLADPDLLMDRIHFLGKVDAVVIPDKYRGNARENFDMAVQYLKGMRHQLPCDLMYCPQFNGHYDDYRDMCKYLLAMVDHFGIRYFGIPRLIAEQGYSRAELCLALKRHRAAWDEPGEFYVHALGMCSGSLQEFWELEHAQCDSIDSSAPVWRGWNGFDIEADKQWRKHGSDCDFDARPESLKPDCEALILSNLRKVGVKC